MGRLQAEWLGTRARPLRARPVHRAEERHRRHRLGLSAQQFFFSWVLGWPLLGIALGWVGWFWPPVRWALAAISPLYALVVFVVFLTISGPQQGGAFGLIVVITVTVLSFAPVASILTGTRTLSLVATGLLTLMLVYFVVGLLLWFPEVTGLIAASIAGPPVLRRAARRSVAADDDRLDALE